MLNKGEEAFMPDLFGDEVVIERNFDQSGASNFKFRATRDGKILSDKRDMLTRMCNHWQINIDSPLCMLTQDNAKTFLARTDPQIMYSVSSVPGLSSSTRGGADPQFFLKGTGLSRIMEEYQATEVHQKKLSRDLANAKEALPEQQDKVRKLQSQIQYAEKARTLRRRQEDLKAQLAWAFVADKERELEQHRVVLEERTAKIETLDGKLAEIDVAQEKAKTDVGELTDDIRTFVEGHRQTQQDMSAKKKKMAEARTALASIKVRVADQSSTNRPGQHQRVQRRDGGARRGDRRDGGEAGCCSP
jgi:chromosome segregation ATPase